MPKRNNHSEGAPLSDEQSHRDLVTFYSRLTHTLENACGRETLAVRLAALLQQTAANETDDIFLQTLSRWFRRLGRVGADCDLSTFAADFIRRTGMAVSRPENQVALLMQLFAMGDDAAAMKAVCGATPQCHACQLTRECDYFNNPRKPEMAALTPAARLGAGNDRTLSDAELLAVILFGDKATGHEPVVANLMARYGRLRAVFRAETMEFQGIRDMSKMQALRMAAISALHRRLLEEKRGDVLRITSARDIYDRYAPELRDYRVEAAVLLMLDQQNSVIRDAWFCEGSPNMAQMNIADLLRPAVREFAVRVALVHNHPGNNPSPSLADLDFTRRLRGACDIIGIGLVDHVIVTESGYYSFAEEGMLGA